MDSTLEGAGFELSVPRRETRLIRIRPSTQKSVERQLADTDDALARQPVRDELSAGVSGPPFYRRNGRRERLERIPPTMSTAPAAMPTRAAPTSNAIPAKARIPMSSAKKAMPTGPSRVIVMRVLWCGPVDTQIREARGQSAPGGMISGSVCRASWPLALVAAASCDPDECTGVMWEVTSGRQRGCYKTSKGERVF